MWKRLKGIYTENPIFPNDTQAIFSKNITRMLNDPENMKYHKVTEIYKKIKSLHTPNKSVKTEIDDGKKHVYYSKEPRYCINERIVVTKNIYLNQKEYVMNGEFGVIKNFHSREITIENKKHICHYYVHVYEVKFTNKEFLFYSISNVNDLDIQRQINTELRELCSCVFNSFEKKEDCEYDKWIQKCNIENTQESYVITVHKSQGSQWKNVIYLLDECSENIDKNMFYTAVSRTREKVYIVYNAGKKIQICDQSKLAIKSESDFISKLW
jgi:ATP-dependent exoDNAse (exonuclease V) alpha subunit